ncbi:MAG: Ppx/GppA phosphatase family protein [bacterium]
MQKLHNTNKLFASIDVGTNTLRLLIAKPNKGNRIFQTIYEAQDICRLGEGIESTSFISQEAEERTLKVLKRYTDKINSLQVRYVKAVSTSVLRRARNSKEFVERVRGETGLSINIISGEEEARLTSIGVLTSLKMGQVDSVIIMDIGGGSTELIKVRDKQTQPEMVVSFDIGVVVLTERYLISDPPTKEEMECLFKHIDNYVGDICSCFNLNSTHNLLVGTAGTLTTLASISQKMQVYNPSLINNYVLFYDEIESVFKRLLSLSKNERSVRIQGLEKGREDIIVAGIAILLVIMRKFSFSSVTVIDTGLREGMMIDLIRTEQGSNQQFSF